MINIHTLQIGDKVIIGSSLSKSTKDWGFAQNMEDMKNQIRSVQCIYKAGSFYKNDGVGLGYKDDKDVCYTFSIEDIFYPIKNDEIINPVKFNTDDLDIQGI